MSWHDEPCTEKQLAAIDYMLFCMSARYTDKYFTKLREEILEKTYHPTKRRASKIIKKLHEIYDNPEKHSFIEMKDVIPEFYDE